MKKLVYLALALCVMVAAFSGCGGKSDDGGNSSAVSSPPATVTPTPTPESQTAKALRVTADSGLNIRAEASTDGEILGLAENGQRLALMLEDPRTAGIRSSTTGRLPLSPLITRRLWRSLWKNTTSCAALPLAQIPPAIPLPLPRLPLRRTTPPPAGRIPLPALLPPVHPPILWTQRTANNAVLFFLPGGP